MAKQRYFNLGPNESLYRHLKFTAFSLKIRPLAREYEDYQGKPPRHRVQEAEDYVRNIYLPGLEHEVAPIMQAGYADNGRVKLALETLADPTKKLPKDIATKAAKLYQTFSSLNWEAPPSLLPTSQQARQSRDASFPSISTTITDPIINRLFAPDGIMHGLLPTRSAHNNRITFTPTRSAHRADVFGHNGLAVGQWFARRSTAILAGATSQRIRGISGDADRGAYAIVVAGGGGAYDGLDLDCGDVVYYSAEGAAACRGLEQQGAAVGNRALTASWRSGRPVRVLRAKEGSLCVRKGPRGGAAGGRALGAVGRRWAPSCGLRYDGLYTVVDRQMQRDSAAGPFARFKLQRVAGQKSLEEVVRESPTAQQIEDYEMLDKIKSLL